ncbi:MAG: HAMP domain-containing sensor histidine kinase [Anaeromyxobacter sp.]
MPLQRVPTPPTAAEADYIRRALSDVRASNARLVAWLRVVARALLLIIWATARLRGDDGGPVSASTGVVVNVVALAVALAVLAQLHRRPSERVILVGAAFDFFSVGLASWLAVERPAGGPIAAAIFMMTAQLLLLWGSLTLPRRALTWLAAAAIAWHCALLWVSGLHPPTAVAMAMLLGVFGYSVSGAGIRMVTLAVRAAAEARAGALARQDAEALRVAKAQLEAARAEAERLTRLIVHDLRNPLASVMASLELAQRTTAPPAARAEALAIATGEVERLSGLAGDLLLVSRLEEGLRPARAGVSLAALLDEVARALRPVIGRAGAALEVRADGAGQAWADPALVRRVLENLLVNAAGHVRPGDRVELAAEPAGAAVRLAVRNSGPPVPPELRPRLFEEGSTSALSAWHHAGLGLHLCALVAAAHGGTVALVERPAWSVSFELELPRAPG